MPYCIYLDSFIGDPCGSVTYTLVAIIYPYGSCLSIGHLNVILFDRDGTCILFDDTKKITQNLFKTYLKPIYLTIGKERHENIKFWSDRTSSL